MPPSPAPSLVRPRGRSRTPTGPTSYAQGADPIRPRDRPRTPKRPTPYASPPPQPSAALNPRSRRLLPTTKTDEKAMAAPAIIGLSRPAAASGSAATL